MQNSARNQFPGRVAAVFKGAVNAEVRLVLDAGGEIVSTITNGSVDRLQLTVGDAVTALVKVSAITLQVGGEAATSARNRLCGEITAAREGAVNGEVAIALPGGDEVVAIVTNESIRNLGLAPGVRVCALVKASSVILAVSG
ncbi:TOBE domain-containing protein [Endothiovibrio diazotrophicus]